jgi:hypothetical protein
MCARRYIRGPGHSWRQRRGAVGQAASVASCIQERARQVTTLEKNPGRKLEGGDSVGTTAVYLTASWRATLRRPPARIRGHQVLAVALAAVDVLRVGAALAFWQQGPEMVARTAPPEFLGHG